MIRLITSIIEAIRGLKPFQVVLVFLLCLIGLGTFYMYRQIDSLEMTLRTEVINDRDRFFREFGINEIETDLMIRDFLVDMQASTLAVQSSLWGYHNGLQIGPFPFRKVTLLDESVAIGAARIGSQFQGMPLNLYIDFTRDL